MQNYLLQPKEFYKLRMFFAALTLSCLIGVAAVVHADQYDAQIQALQSKNSQAKSSLSQLQLTASSYQDAINQLQDQINQAEQQIASSQAEQASLQQQITADEAQIVSEKSTLADDIRTMYVDGQLTTIEELATSKNLSDYVDKEENRIVVQNAVDNTITTIGTEEQQLQAHKTAVSELLATEQTQQAQLDGEQAQQSQLLALNTSQQSQYNQQIANNNSQIKQLQAEQAAAIRALQVGTTSGGSGSYPWANASCPFAGGPSCGNYDWEYNGYPYDQWGYEYRNCTSYVAWKISATSSSPIINELISQLGNAAQWPGGAAARGVPVSYGEDPQAGDAAVDPGGGGWQGHVMYVQQVNSDGSLFISQYNAQENGTYSTATIPASEVSALDFIHFPGM